MVLAAVCTATLSGAMMLGQALPGSEIIAYTHDTNGVTDIYLLDLGRNQRINITHTTAATEERPVWSPDGTRIAYELTSRSPTQLCIWQFAARRRCFEPVGSFDNLPVWSPDGRWLLFNTPVTDGGNLFLLDTEAEAARPLNVTTEQVRRAYSWSPDSARIAFAQYLRSDDVRLSILNIDTGEIDPLLPFELATDMLVTWSPRSEQIAFISDTSGGYRVYVADAKTGIVRQLTEQPGYDQFISWSPDGSTLLLVSNRAGDDIDIFSLDPNTGSIQLLTDNAGLDERPTWSADGQRIAFTSDRDGDVHIYVMNADGRDVRRVTFAAGRNTDPAWQP
jgi:Tol biopolymer transport system component